MSGVTQVVFMNHRSFATPPVIGGLTIGQAYQGGFFAGQISTAGNGVANFNLVVSPFSTGDSGPMNWKTSITSTAGTSSEIDGPTNSANMNNSSHPAAFFCRGLSIGGYSDWYLPAKNELEVCYFYLKATTDSNDTSSGANPNAVPSRASNYTASLPAQTAATDFQWGASQAFSQPHYWSSTEAGVTGAWATYFPNGLQTVGSKLYNSMRVRAVRRVAV